MKDPQDWKSGDDPATPSQESYLETLSEQTGDDVPGGLTKAAASEKIDELRAKVGLDDNGATDDSVVGVGGPDAGEGGRIYGVPPIDPNRDE
jgi:Protein of unknown function (DUF3072)